MQTRRMCGLRDTRRSKTLAGISSMFGCPLKIVTMLDWTLQVFLSLVNSKDLHRNMDGCYVARCKQLGKACKPVLCDACPRGGHLSCLGRTTAEAKADLFYCNICQEVRTTLTTMHDLCVVQSALVLNQTTSLQIVVTAGWADSHAGLCFQPTSP